MFCENAQHMGYWERELYGIPGDYLDPNIDDKVSKNNKLYSSSVWYAQWYADRAVSLKLGKSQQM